MSNLPPLPAAAQLCHMSRPPAVPAGVLAMLAAAVLDARELDPWELLAALQLAIFARDDALLLRLVQGFAMEPWLKPTEWPGVAPILLHHTLGWGTLAAMEELLSLVEGLRSLDSLYFSPLLFAATKRRDALDLLVSYSCLPNWGGVFALLDNADALEAYRAAAGPLPPPRVLRGSLRVG